MTIDDALAHAGRLDRFDQDLLDDIADHMPGYLWIVEAADDIGYPMFDDRPCRVIHCGRCHYEWVEVKRRGRYERAYRQGTDFTCPHCGREVTVKHVSKGIKGIYDRLDVIFYRKSAISENAVVAIAAYCERSYRYADLREPWREDPALIVEGIAAFDIDSRDDIRIQMRPVYKQVGDEWIPTGDVIWRRVRSMDHMAFGNHGLFMHSRPERVALAETLDNAIRGTPFERAWSDDYWWHTDGVRAMDLITRYPCVEYFTRLGLERFVVDKIEKTLPPNLINWRGKSMSGVLKLSRSRLGEIKGAGVKLTPELCAVLQMAEKRGIRCGVKIAQGVALAWQEGAHRPAVWLGSALDMFPRERQAKALKYIAKNRHTGLRAIMDFWQMLQKAGGTLNDDDAFPANFRAAHDRLAERIRSIEDAEKDEKIARRLPALEKRFGFAFGGLILRPAASAREVVREGQALHHCVGNYVERYAEGATAIFVLRRAVQPDEPWRTVEINPKTGAMLQDRGFRNDWNDWNDYRIDEHYRAALDLFWRAWKDRKKGRAA